MNWPALIIISLIVLLVRLSAYATSQRKGKELIHERFNELFTHARLQADVIIEQGVVIDALSKEVNLMHSQGDLSDVERFSTALLKAYAADPKRSDWESFDVYRLRRSPFSDN